MHNALIGMIIPIGEERPPPPRQLLLVHSIAVVLTGDVAPARARVHARLVVPAVAVPGIGKEYQIN